MGLYQAGGVCQPFPRTSQMVHGLLLLYALVRQDADTVMRRRASLPFVQCLAAQLAPYMLTP